jgi:hypothetical protein
VVSEVMDLVLLRQLVGGVIAVLGITTRTRSSAGMRAAWAARTSPREDDGTKRQRVQSSFAALPDASLRTRPSRS